MRIAAILFTLVFPAAAAGAPQSARTAGKADNRQAAEKAAKKACLVGDFKKGIDLLADLYVETNVATYIYNQGRCFEQSHRWEDAIDRFQEYLRKVPNLPADERADVDNHISDCTARQAKLAPPPGSPMTLSTPPSSLAINSSEAQSAGTVSLAASPPRTEAEPHPGSRMRTVGVVSAAAGLAALGGGLIFNLMANRLTDELHSAPIWDRGKASRQGTYEVLGWVGYGVGAVALVTGTTLFIVSGHSNATADARPTLSLVPVFLPGVSALSLQGLY